MLTRLLILVCSVSVSIAGILHFYQNYMATEYKTISQYSQRIIIYRRFNALPLEQAISEWNNNINNINEIMFDLEG